MRRRRQQLQVSTFPFLAVLLCAMGALILVLLVMDRRSRLAALQKARETVEHTLKQRKMEHDRLAAQRRREFEDKLRAQKKVWETKKAKLQRRVREEEQSLERQLAEVKTRLAEAAARLHKEQAAAEDLRKKLQGEKSLVHGKEQALADARKQADEAAKQLDASEQARARLAAELVRLESALKELRDSRKYDKHTYSLIPYHGKRGDNRRPIYVECSATGHVFLPEKKEITTGENLRGELGLRLAAHRERLKAAGHGDRAPYVMLLVRPDGVGRYYEMQAAARDLGIEFGYEFVEKDWVLQVPDEEPPPSTLVKQQKPTAPSIPRTSLAPFTTDGKGEKGDGSGRGHREQVAIGTGRNGSGGTGAAGASLGSVLSPGIGMPGALNAPIPGTAGSGVAHGHPPGNDPGSAGHSLSSGKGGNSAPWEVIERGTGTPPTVGPPRETANNELAGQGGRTGGAGGEKSAVRLIAPVPGQGTPGEGDRTGTPEQGSPEKGHDGTAGSTVRQNASQQPVQPRDKHVPTLLPDLNQTTKARTPPKVAGLNSSTPGDQKMPSIGPAVPQPAAPKQPRALRPARVGGDSETIIFIECCSDIVIIHPTRRRVPIESLNHSPAYNTLYTAVRQMAQKREAQARAGEKPRVQVRFLVHRDGEQTFHLAYPAVEPLKLPMTRYGLLPWDRVERIVSEY